ncbi:hypothetical protein QT995_17055 [Microcoleus sp. S36b_A3]|uniref:hypothetical protein n=1 Tax=unclassified Microcoleus TaxID=2642155 RepID=UPI002FD557C0
MKELLLILFIAAQQIPHIPAVNHSRQVTRTSRFPLPLKVTMPKSSTKPPHVKLFSLWLYLIPA